MLGALRSRMEDFSQERLDAEMVGLDPQDPLPFQFTPGARFTPVLMSFPHVGLGWPAGLGPKPRVDFPRNADFEVHTLFRGVEAWGIATVRATWSRLVVDLNRAEDDVSSILVPDHPSPQPRRRPGAPSSTDPLDHGHRWDRPGRGVVWASAMGAHGRTAPVLAHPLAYGDFAERIARYHRPYHRALEILLERRRQRFGYAVLVDGHSMPGSVGVDLVVGTLDGTSCSPRLRDFVLHRLGGEPASAMALMSVRADDPYRGGEIVRRFGRPDLGLHAFQLEVNRRLYMDEHRYALLPWPRDATEDAAGAARVSAAGRPARPRADRPEERRQRELGELLRRVRSLAHQLVEESPSIELAPERPPLGLGQAAE